MNANTNYPGDTAWFGYIDSIRPMWTSYPNKNELITALNGCEDLAIAVFFGVGERALEWVDEPVPALGMGIPRAFAANDAKRNVLRSMLMSMP
jgi:hypothetical protein